MSGGYIVEGGGRLVVVSPYLPNGCADCNSAVECANSVRNAFKEVTSLEHVQMAGKDKATLASELQNEEPHRTVLTNFDIVSGAFRDLMDRCNENAMDVYQQGEFIGVECGATGLVEEITGR